MHGVLNNMSTLLVLATAVALFARLRSGAAGLFLLGTLFQSLFPIVSFHLGLKQVSVVYLYLGSVCAGIGLLWHAMSTPKVVKQRHTLTLEGFDVDV